MRFFDENFVVTPGHSDCQRNTRLVLRLSRGGWREANFHIVPQHFHLAVAAQRQA